MAVSNFEAPLAAFAKLIDVNLKTVVRVIVGELWSGFVLRTPVDTGRARASWIVTESSPSSFVPDETTHSFPSASAAGVTNVSGTTNVYILSNLDYMRYLEEGTSDQAPLGMVTITIAEVEARIEILVEKIQKGYTS